MGHPLQPTHGRAIAPPGSRSPTRRQRPTATACSHDPLPARNSHVPGQQLAYRTSNLPPASATPGPYQRPRAAEPTSLTSNSRPSPATPGQRRQRPSRTSHLPARTSHLAPVPATSPPVAACAAACRISGFLSASATRGPNHQLPEPRPTSGPPPTPRLPAQTTPHRPPSSRKARGEPFSEMQLSWHHVPAGARPDGPSSGSPRIRRAVRPPPPPSPPPGPTRLRRVVGGGPAGGRGRGVGGPWDTAAAGPRTGRRRLPNAGV